MRLLIAFGIIVGLAFAAQAIRPQCSMANMIGVEWLQCLMVSKQKAPLGTALSFMSLL